MITSNKNTQLNKPDAMLAVSLLKELNRLEVLDDKTLKKVVQNISNGVSYDISKNLAIIERLDDLVSSI